MAPPLRPRWPSLLLPALLAVPLAAADCAQAHAQEREAYRQGPRQTWRRRGVYFFEGPYRSPMAGMGTRSAYATNRVALDDDRSVASWDPAGRKLVLRNTHAYADETQIACVLLLGEGTTSAGQTVPVGVHLNVSKEGAEFVTSLHAHVAVREGVRTALLLPCQVVLDDGARRRVALTLTDALRVLREPFSDSFLATIIGLEGVDHLAGRSVDLARPGARLADGSVKLGHGPLATKVLRATFVALDGAQPLPPGRPWATIFARGGYELRLQATSSLLPSGPWKRNIFLLGLEEVPILASVRREGLADGQTLAFTFREGRGAVRLDDRSWPVPGAAEVVRRYLEFDFIGAIVAHQLRLRLAGTPADTSR
ncbi:MAG: hypothetical protein D6731_05530 [Planctomycetota bacterium]|nr:MAG: hypothetical protein D6731_05530 [Planctomycetota bacterium]